MKPTEPERIRFDEQLRQAFPDVGGTAWPDPERREPEWILIDAAPFTAARVDFAQPPTAARLAQVAAWVAAYDWTIRRKHAGELAADLLALSPAAFRAALAATLARLAETDPGLLDAWTAAGLPLTPETPSTRKSTRP